MICRHFGACGGCATQDVPYADEIAAKEAALREVFLEDVAVVPSPREFHYRTRMDYVFAWHKLGLRKKGDPRGVLDLEECLLPSERAFQVVLKVKDALHRHDLRSHNYISRKGYLRYVTVREAPRNGQLMLVFLTNGFDPAVEPVLDEAAQWADAVVWSVSEARADVSQGEVKEHRNRDWIEERVGDNVLRFGPNSFFQSNPWLTGELYAYVAERVRGKVADLYCGVGGLALAAARGGGAGAVLGVDDNAEAVAFARHNAEANGLDVAFEVADAGPFLVEHECDTAIVDPPRVGLGFGPVLRIVDAAPPRIVYVTCNPKRLALELQQFSGYRVTDMKGFDLFPRTPHFEVVATLDRE